MSGSTIRRIQRRLTAAGFGPIDVDGVFGPQTDAAVRAPPAGQGADGRRRRRPADAGRARLSAATGGSFPAGKEPPTRISLERTGPAALGRGTDRRVRARCTRSTTSSSRSPVWSTSVPLDERRVAVATREHEVVGDDADACRSARPASRAGRPVRRLPDAVDHRRRCRCSGTRSSGPRPAGSGRCAIAGVADGAEPVRRSAGRELRAGERLDHRAVAERQHGEHLAPRDLAGLLAGGDRGADGRSCAQAAGVGDRGLDASRRTSRASRRRPGCPSPTRAGAPGSRRMSTVCVPITPVAQRRRVGVGLVDDRLHVGPRRDAEVLGHARRRAGPGDVAAA